MTTEQLNEYIKHYLEEDKTKSAIMLNAPWGTGKSYYIQNELIPFLANGKTNRCVVVSMYGLTKLSEISKSLYLEIRTESIKKKLNSFNEKVSSKIKNLSKNKEVIAVTKGVGKTLIKGVASGFGFDLSVDDKDLEKLYASIDLTDKLIVFEDIERSSINILEFMGYVNNLVEQDGIKVLLVANEDAIKKYVPISKDDDNAKERYGDLFKSEGVHSDETKQYLKVKEKTISDTVNFENDYLVAIENIIRSFENEMLNQYLGDESIIEILKLFKTHKIYNLRTFTFACQKTVDIYKKIGGKYSLDFIKCIFYGNIVFSNKLKTGQKIKWDGNGYYSLSLGDSNYPLLGFCYDYILNQSADFEILNEYEAEFKKAKLYDKNKSLSDYDLSVLYNSYIKTELEVRLAIESIGRRLSNVGDISFYEYGRLANNLMLTSTFLDLDLSKHKELLVKNLFGRGGEIDAHSLFHITTEISDVEKKKEYAELKKAMIDSLKGDDNEYYGLTYNVNSIVDFCDKVYGKHGEILSNKSFASNIDIKKFSEMILQCSAEQIHEIRFVFIKVYESSNIGTFLSGDKPSIDALLENIKSIKNDERFDKIQQMQLNAFIKNLENISEKLTQK